MQFAQNAEVKTISGQVQRSLKEKVSRRERIKKNLKSIILVVTLGYVSFTSYSCYSLPAPFLPREAEKKGLTPFEYGIIFASYEIVRLFMSPVCSAIVSFLLPGSSQRYSQWWQISNLVLSSFLSQSKWHPKYFYWPAYSSNPSVLHCSVWSPTQDRQEPSLFALWSFEW